MKLVTKFAGMFSVVLIACADDPVNPQCTTDCAADVHITSLEVSFPNPGMDLIPIAYGGDTLQIHVEVTNRGTATSDSMQLGGNTGWSWDSLALPIVPPLRPGEVFETNVKLVLHQFLPAHASQNYGIFLYLASVDYPNFGFGSAYTIFTMKPTTLSVPGTLAYPTMTGVVTIDNPSPRTIPADTLHVCLENFSSQCVATQKIALAAIAPREKREVPVDVSLVRSDAADLQYVTGWRQRLKACYGRESNGGYCVGIIADVVPDFEEYCAVRRIIAGESVQSTTARGCTTTTSGRLDILSMEAVAGTVYETQYAGASRVRAVGPRGHLLGALPDSGRIQLGTGGRVYIVVEGPGAYTFQLRQLN